jgi:hypothetical protein
LETFEAAKRNFIVYVGNESGGEKKGKREKSMQNIAVATPLFCTLI